MSVLATPTMFKYTPAWRAMIWRSATFNVHAPLDTWHPRPRDGEWYQVGIAFLDRSIGGVPSGASESWRRGIYTGGQHEANARIACHSRQWER
jgi:hypothetical protein